MDMIRGVIENTVPLAMFNKGLAGKIFDEVKRCGAKVVLKNNAAECVLLSPEQYVRMVDELNDARLLATANERMSAFDPTNVITQEQFDRDFGIKPDDLNNGKEIEFE